MIGEVVGVGDGVGLVVDRALVGEDVAPRVVGEDGRAAVIRERGQPPDAEVSLIVGIGHIVIRRRRIGLREDAIQLVKRAVGDHKI